ncbi:protocadherin alpha-4-like [Styela clava]
MVDLLRSVVLLFCILEHGNAAPRRVKSTVHIQESISKGEIVVEVSQLITGSRNSHSRTYKLISQKVHAISNGFETDLKIKEKFLEIERNTGTVKLAKVFDRDEICSGVQTCIIKAQIAVLPHAAFKLVELDIVIDDVNDNKPTFPVATLQLNVSESSAIGDVINLDAYQAKDYDFGRNSHLRYTTTQNKQFNLKFFVDDKNSSHLRLYVIDELDHETAPEIKLDVWARDAGAPSLAGQMRLVINIIDVNDNQPIFEEEEYIISIEENAPRGTTIAMLKAHDPDSGLYGHIRYFISTRNSKLVQKLARIDENRGTVWIRESLDREKHNGLRVLIEARDSDPENPKTGETWLTINVKDINDNSPVITADYISQSDEDTVYVSESTGNGSYIAKISVSDSDHGKNGKLEVSLTTLRANSKRNKNDKDQNDRHFALTEDGFLETREIFDRETCSQYRIFIRACDQGTPQRCSNKEITVVILDVNEYAPNIETPLKTVTMREDAYVGTTVAKIIANDGDSANGFALTRNKTDHIVKSRNGDVTFSITRGNAGVFSIDKGTGLIRLISPLDREKRSEWKLTVSARDGGSPFLESFSTVIVKVTDVNDNAPIFVNPGVNNSLIYADISTNEVITTIKARDVDHDKNGKVSYYIIPKLTSSEKKSNLNNTNSYFILNPVSGDLRLNFSKPNVTNAIGVHSIIIKAKDSGPVPQETNILLRIAVGEYGNSNRRNMEVSSASVNFLVLAISLGCAAAFLVFLIIGVVVKCRRMNREINSMNKAGLSRQNSQDKFAKPEIRLSVKSLNKNSTTEMNNVKGEKGDYQPTKSESFQVSSEPKQILPEHLKSSTNIHHIHNLTVPSLDVGGGRASSACDSDSGKGESDVEAASLLVNESRAYHQRKELGAQCTETCRIYGHSDECWMPTKNEIGGRFQNPSNGALSYDWDKLRSRYYSPDREAPSRKNSSRCSYASTSNTDNGSFAPSEATSHHSVYDAVQEDDNRRACYRLRHHGLRHGHRPRQTDFDAHLAPLPQPYPTLPSNYNTNTTTAQLCSTYRQLDAVYEVNYSSKDSYVHQAPVLARGETQYNTRRVPRPCDLNVIPLSKSSLSNLSHLSSRHSSPTRQPTEMKVSMQEAREILDGIESLLV